MSRIKRDLVLDIQGNQISVVVDGTGTFWAEWEGDTFRSETFKGLRAKMLPKVRTDLKRCELPALRRAYSDEWEEITLIGIHADNGNVLYRDADEKTHQVGRRDNRIYRPLTKMELREHDRLVARVKVAQGALNAWLKARVLYPGAAVRKVLGLPAEKNRDEPLDDDEDLT